MRVGMLAATVFAVVLAISSFILVELAANAYISREYLSEENKLERERAYAAELQKYVEDNNLSSVDVAKLADWAQSNRYLYVMIHKDDKLLFETGQYDKPEPPNGDAVDPDGGETDPDGSGSGIEGDGGAQVPDDNLPGDGGEDGTTDPDGGAGDSTDPDGTAPGTGNGSTGSSGGSTGSNGGKDDENENPFGSGITIDMPTREELMAYAAEKEAHLITMSDASVLVSMADFTEYLYYDITNIVAIILAVIVLVIVVLLYSHGVTRRITRIASDVAVVAEGNMDHSIRPDGVDELGRLSRDVESMRSAMLENVAKEREAMDANAELVTSISHDIRTPLTVLLGYLNVMKLHAPDEEMMSYINASEKTALRLKKLSDDMFSYFLLFGGGATEVDMQEYDAYTLFDQMLSEHVLLLREQGYNVELDIADILTGTVVSTDAGLLKRIIENVMSNILKYADKEHPVSLSARVSDGVLTVRATNVIDHPSVGVESNRIGLKTCRKLASVIGATFGTEEADGRFTVTLIMDAGAKGDRE